MKLPQLPNSQRKNGIRLNSVPLIAPVIRAIKAWADMTFYAIPPQVLLAEILIAAILVGLCVALSR